MLNAKTFKNLMTATLLVLAIAGAGCDMVEDQLDKYTVRNFDYTSSFYSGETVRSVATLKLAENTTISSLNVREVSRVALSDLEEPLAAINMGIEDVALELVGSVENLSENEGRTYIFFAPNETPDQNESHLIGSFPLGAMEKVVFSGSDGFDQSFEEVQDNILTYLNSYPDREIFHVFLYSEGVYTESIAVNFLNLSASPTFMRENPLPPITLGNKKQTLEDIVKVSVSGSFANNGFLPARVVWLVGGDDENLNMDEHVVIDAWVDAGDTLDAQEGLVSDGLRFLKSYIEDMMVDQKSIEAKMVITSDGGLNMNVKDFKIEVTAKINVYDVNF